MWRLRIWVTPASRRPRQMTAKFPSEPTTRESRNSSGIAYHPKTVQDSRKLVFQFECKGRTKTMPRLGFPLISWKVRLVLLRP
jgi:hypothetical protein